MWTTPKPKGSIVNIKSRQIVWTHDWKTMWLIQGYTMIFSNFTRLLFPNFFIICGNQSFMVPNCSLCLGESYKIYWKIGMDLIFEVLLISQNTTKKLTWLHWVTCRKDRFLGYKSQFKTHTLSLDFIYNFTFLMKDLLFLDMLPNLLKNWIFLNIMVLELIWSYKSASNPILLTVFS